MPSAKTPTVTYMQVREAATGSLDGAPFVLHPTEILAATHPLVRAYPHFFKPLEPGRERPAVEQMTAVPGEKRGER